MAVRFRAVRQRRIRVHRIPLRVRDDREPPLWKERDGISIIRKSEAVKPYSEIRKKYIPASAPANRREKRHPCATTRARQRNEEATLLPHWINIIHSQ